jgi:hypothetical protein
MICPDKIKHYDPELLCWLITVNTILISRKIIEKHYEKEKKQS